MPSFVLERALWKEGLSHVAGVDEAGRGPLAGPVVAAAVILPSEWPLAKDLNDSKLLSPKRRMLLYQQIRKHALAWRACSVSSLRIDRMNILQASLLAMRCAVERLPLPAEHVLVDGNQLPVLPCQATTVIRGDQRCHSIAAASILAKVLRDRIMEAWHLRYPQWGFSTHKGYPTRAHRVALQRWGICPLHRRSFRGVEDAPRI